MANNNTVYELRTFADLAAAVREELKIQVGDTTALNRIKRLINLMYQDEVLPFAQWKWQRKSINISHEPFLNNGTVAVATGSNIATLSVVPGVSKQTYYFSVEGYNEIYRIQQHAATSTTLVLEVPFNGGTNATAGYKIWTDRIALPADARETFQVTHGFSDTPLDNIGLEQFRRLVTSEPKAQRRPLWYTTSDYVSPSRFASIVRLPALLTRSSSGLVKTLTFASSVSTLISLNDFIQVSGSANYAYNGEWRVSSVSGAVITFTSTVNINETATVDSTLTVMEATSDTASERYREMLVYPSINDTRTALHVDYIHEAPPLSADTDEPIIPLSDRVVLFYGALSLAWSSIGRDPQEAARNRGLFEAKLGRMAGKLDDSTDQPILRPSKLYLGQKRTATRFRDAKYANLGIAGGGSNGSQANPSGTANTAAIFDSTGSLQGSLTVSTVELGQLDGVTSPILGQSDVGTLTNKTINANSNTLSNIANASIASAAAIAYSKLNLTNSIANADIASAAAIAYSKLALTGLIVNTDISTSAAIARSKLATGTINQVIINDGSGVLTSEATLAKTRGGSGQDNSSLTFPSTGTLATRAGSETLTNKTIAVGSNIITGLPGSTALKAITVQSFAGGSSGTYTTPTSPVPLYIEVEMIGGGGGGGGSASSAANGGAGGAGGNTTFGTTLLSANGGAGGSVAGGTNLGGNGGTASLGSGPVGIALQGGSGTAISGDTTAQLSAGGPGAPGPFGGAGGGGVASVGKAGINGSGSGGGGGGSPSAGFSGAGGGAGGYVKALIASPTTTYTYSVGGGGLAGTAGTSGFLGGVGADGAIIVREYYQ